MEKIGYSSKCMVVNRFFNPRTVSLGIVFLVLAFTAGWFAHRGLAISESSSSAAVRDENSGYQYIKPLLLCNGVDTLPSTVYDPLRNALAEILDDEVKKGNLNEGSVYFRDLPLGAWTAINVNDNYIPASLMKVPIMIAFLKQAEKHPDILEQKLFADPDRFPPWLQDIPPDESVISGRSYTIDELIRFMIVYSDNRAMQMLMTAIDQHELTEVLYDLGVPLPLADGDYAITPHAYSFFFRVLYNATYLDRAMSERALSLLANTTFAAGLRAGVPEDIVIAKKFGEATDPENPHAIPELHDCGIIYAPSGDYLLCIMTKGQNVEKLSTVIARLSELVYDMVPDLRMDIR